MRFLAQQQQQQQQQQHLHSFGLSDGGPRQASDGQKTGPEEVGEAEDVQAMLSGAAVERAMKRNEQPTLEDLRGSTTASIEGQVSEMPLLWL